MKEYKTGTFIMGRCTVVVTKTVNDNWQMVIACKPNVPSQREIVKARYKYLPDDIIMAKIYPSREEFNAVPENINILIQIIN